MRKYWTIFKISWQNSIEYRADFFAHVALGLISLAVTTLIFKAVFSQVQNLAGYTFSTMFSYLVMTKILHFSTRGNTSRYIGDEIKEGKLSMYLVKPISYLRYWLASFLADRLFEIVIRFSFLILFFIFFQTFFKFPSVGIMVCFGLSLIVALMLNYLINVIIASFAFWIIDLRLVSSVLGLATGFLAGELIPLDVLPQALKTLSSFLPFQYSLFFPIKIFQGSLSLIEIIKGFLMAIVWVVILTILTKHLWQKGLKNYESIGQ